MKTMKRAKEIAAEAAELGRTLNGCPVGKLIGADNRRVNFSADGRTHDGVVARAYFYGLPENHRREVFGSRWRSGERIISPAAFAVWRQYFPLYELDCELDDNADKFGSRQAQDIAAAERQREWRRATPPAAAELEKLRKAEKFGECLSKRYPEQAGEIAAHLEDFRRSANAQVR